MSRSINRVTLLGNLGKDAETKFTSTGTSVSNFSLATTRRVKRNEEWADETEWHRVVLWRSENVSNYLLRGKQVLVEGRLQTRSWDKDGEKRYSTEIVAENLILLGGGDKKPIDPDPPFNSGPEPAAISDDYVPF
jgi:single-strand DNA-binding protein